MRLPESSFLAGCVPFQPILRKLSNISRFTASTLPNMSKKNIFVLTVAFVAVAGIYYYLYKDSFRKEHIQISHTFRPNGWNLVKIASGSNDELTKLIYFALGGEYKLTSVKVIAVPELETNKYPHPVWELTSESNSAPTRTFQYGGHIHGMHPPVKGERPGTLEANIPYRLFIEAGQLKGEHDFTVTSENHVAQ